MLNLIVYLQKELIIEEPRVRKKTTRYGNDNGVVDMSDLASSSDSDTDSKSNQGRGRRGKRKQDEDTDFESERHVAKSHGPGYGRSELFKVEKGLLVFGYVNILTVIVLYESAKSNFFKELGGVVQN